MILGPSYWGRQISVAHQGNMYSKAQLPARVRELTDGLGLKGYLLAWVLGPYRVSESRGYLEGLIYFLFFKALLCVRTAIGYLMAPLSP